MLIIYWLCSMISLMGSFWLLNTHLKSGNDVMLTDILIFLLFIFWPFINFIFAVCIVILWLLELISFMWRLTGINIDKVIIKGKK